MGKIQELYDTRVRPMVPAERLQLARLILDDLAPSENAGEAKVDISDEWGDDDLAEVAAYAARQADRSAGGDGRSRP
jgi:hypothetical protein